jgi:hypothetical protein
LTPVQARSLAAGLLIALSLSVGLLFTFSYPLPEVRNDAVVYLSLARNVAAGSGFTQDGVTPMVYRPPLFSGLLGGWFFLTGTSSALSAAVFQSLLHGAGVLAAFLLFLEVSSPAWAFAGGAWLAVNPLLVTRVPFVLQEPTLLLTTTLAAWLSIRLVKAPSVPRAAWAGLGWGVCALAKVAAWFAPLLLLGMRLLPGRAGWAWRKREAAVLLLCSVGVIAPWTARNYVLFDRFIPVNAQGAGMLKWNVMHAEIPGERPGSSLVEELYRKEMPESERNARMREYILAHPGYFFGYRVLKNAVHFAAPPRDWWIARGHFPPGEHRTAFWVLAALFHIPLYVLLLLRTIRWWKDKGPPAAGFLLLFYWAYWGQHAVVWGDPRFGLAVYPVLVAIALPAALNPEAAGGHGGRTPAPS